MLLGTDCDTNAALSATGVGVLVGATVVTGVRVKVGVGGGSDAVGFGVPGAMSSKQPALATTWEIWLLLQGENFCCSEGDSTGFMMYVPGSLAHTDPD